MKYFLHLVLLCAGVLAARAQSTAFTYQGRLAAEGTPFSGSADMQFTLFSDPTGGVSVAGTNIIAGVNVSGGLFAASLDFGTAAFQGEDRWLEVQVRTNSGVGAFTTLTPRQPLTPTPYALFARTAGTALGPWALSGSALSYTSGKVGIGTTLPKAALDVRGTIRLGKGSGDWATASLVNLRIIRGTVHGDGTPKAGLGFKATRVSLGDHHIDFDPPFASAPSVTATVDDGMEALDLVDYYVAGVFDSTKDSVRIRVRQQAASISTKGGTGPWDWPFHFIAMGPR